MPSTKNRTERSATFRVKIWNRGTPSVVTVPAEVMRRLKLRKGWIVEVTVRKR